MATTIGKLNFMVSADANGVRTGLLVGEQAFNGFVGRITASYQSLIAKFQFNPFMQLASWAVKLTAESQRAEAGFRTFLGSAEAAKDLLAEIRQFALESPLNSSEISQATNTLLGYGVAGDQVMGMIRQLGEISGGVGEKLQLLALAMGQVAAKGRLQGQELRQLTEHGFNPLQVIAENTGVDMGVLLKRMEDGKISFEMVSEAMRLATEEGGRFHGRLGELLDTLPGQWDQLKESTEALGRSIGEFLTPTLIGVIKTGTEIVDWLKNMDLGTVQTAAQLTALAGTFITVVNILPKLISVGAGFVRTLRAIAIGEATVQALSGPQGWATVLIGLGAAATAGYAISSMFDSIESKLPSITAEAEKTKQAISTVFSPLTEQGADPIAPLTERLKQLKGEAQDLKKQMRDLNEHGRGNTLVGAAERFTQEGFAAPFKAQESLVKNAVDAAKDAITQKLDEIRQEEERVREEIRDKKIEVKEARI